MTPVPIRHASSRRFKGRREGLSVSRSSTLSRQDYSAQAKMRLVNFVHVLDTSNCGDDAYHQQGNAYRCYPLMSGNPCMKAVVTQHSEGCVLYLSKEVI